RAAPHGGVCQGRRPRAGAAGGAEQGINKGIRQMKKLAIMLAAAVLSMPVSTLRGQDRITYNDRAKKAEQLATGAIEEETPAKIVYKVTAGRREIPAADIIDIEYQLPGEARLEYRRALNQQKSADKAPTDAERTN